MLRLTIDDTQFKKDIKNIIGYSFGFFEGVKQGLPEFWVNASRDIIESLKQYIDANARVTPQLLHHMYEWNQTGSPNARLFDIGYTISGGGLSVFSSFSQSRTIKAGSRVPFYDKARIMENGIPVTIVPKKKLVFEVEGETVYTANPVIVNNPGGQVQGEYEKVFNSFFTTYFAQSYLQSSGILSYLSAPSDFYKNISKRSGRPQGIATGRNWMAKAGKI